MLYPKYNRELVGRITGLEGIELNEFMIFCNFDPGFLLESTDYQIAEAVLRKLEEWKKTRIQNSKKKSLKGSIE